MPFPELSPEPLVRLRRLVGQDANVMAGWGDDPEFCQAADWTATLLHAERLDRFRRLIASPPKDLIRFAAVCENTLVGYVDLHGTQSDERELGFVIGPRSRWGGGLGRATASAGLAYGFDTLRLHRIWAEAFATNPGSLRILQGLGMTELSRGQPGHFLGEATYYRRFEMTAASWCDSQLGRFS